jgi:hypothetical protein
MKTNIVQFGLLALLAGAAAPLAHAQSYPINNGAPTGGPYNYGDLIVGFYDTGNSQEYSLDLGPLSNFNLLANFEIPNSSTDMAADLTTQFSTWYGNSSVYFGLAAAPGNDAYITDPVGNAAWSGNGTEGAVYGGLNNFAGNYYFNSGSGASDGSLESTGETPGPTWFEEVNQTNGAFGDFKDQGAVYGDKYISNITTGTDNFDYLEASDNSEQTLGAWTVDSSGDLFYTAAVPEPSTIATVLLGAAALVGFRFRRRA